MTDRVEIVAYDPQWPERFAAIAAEISAMVGDDAVRIDHIGSTSVPGLAAKDVIDIQVTVRDLSRADAWPDQFAGFRRRPHDLDHIPPSGPDDPREWEKRYWTRHEEPRAHLHVREEGRANQRYALLFRDFLRTSEPSARAYERTKRALAEKDPGDVDGYYAVKDPVCDLIIDAAERWAVRHEWGPGPVERISAVTLATRDMHAAVAFYAALRLHLLYGGADAEFTSFRVGSGFLNLQLDPRHTAVDPVWGRVILWVDDVDAMFDRAVAAGFTPATSPADADWGERYFHIRDPDGHELSFARPIRHG